MKLKIVLSALGFCGVCGVGYFSLRKGDDNREKSNKRDSLFGSKVLLDVYSNKDSERWKDLSYAYSRDENNLLISSISKTSSKSDIAYQLQEWCKKKLESEVEMEERIRVERWCTVPNNIKEKLKSDGYVSLPSYNDSDDESLRRWNEIFNKYKEAFEGEDTSNVIGVGDYNKENTQSLDEKRQFTETCQEQLTYDMPEDPQDRNLVSSRQWCMWKEA